MQHHTIRNRSGRASHSTVSPDVAVAPGSRPWQLLCFLGYVSSRGFAFGPIEAVALTVFIGFACDYCVHTSQLYHMWRPVLRHQGGEAVFTRTLAHAGPSLYGAALTTVGACVPLLWCQVVRKGAFTPLAAADASVWPL